MSGITFELPGFDQQHEREQERERQQRDRHAEEVDELLAAALLSSDVTATAAAGGARRAQQRKGWGFGVGAAAGDEENEDDEEAADRSASGGALQELLLPWHCQSCTLRNDAARGACEACGLVNKRRARLRARGQEERRALLARKAEEKRSVAERMEDLEELGDDGDDDDDDEVIVVEAGDDGDGNDSDVVVVIEKAPAPPRRQQQLSPSPQPAPARASSTSSSTSSSAAAPTPLARLTPMLLHGGLSPFGVLPADLALHALHFLQDPVAYSGLRALSKGWSRVAEHESLWRPLAEARFKPPPPSPPPARTPTPQAPAASASGSASVSASSDGRARRESAASSSSLGLPASWSCKACGLLQADRFGLHCEFCQAEREIVGASPAAAAAASAASATAAASAGDGEEEEEEEEEPACCFRVIKNYDELALAWRSSGGRGGKTLGEGGGGGEEGGAEAPPKADRPLYSEEKKRQADAAALEASSRLMTGAGSTPEGHERVHLAGAGVQSVWAVALATGDFYFLYKLLALDRALSARWDSLHAGYEWLANSARAALRTRLYATREQIYQRDDSLISIPESFQKVVNKLTARAWPRLWECMRVELGLQAEALRRDALRHLRQAIGGGNGSGGGGGGSGVVKGYRLLLEEVLRAFRVFAQWAFEVCAFFGKLNDQISGERFRATTSTLVGCGVKEAAATPYVSELALLGFRDRFLMHFAVRTPLLGAVEGDAALSVAALWGPAGPDLTGGGGAGGGRGAAAAVAAAEETGVEPEESEVDRRVLRQRAETDAAAAAAAAGGGGHGGGAEGAAERQRAAEEGARRRVIENVSDLLQALGKVCEELDVPEGAPVDEGEGGVPLGPAYRRFILRPLRDTLAEMRVDGVVGGLGGGEGEGEGEEGVAGVGGVSLKEESLCGGGGGGGGGGRAWGRGSFRRQRGGLEDGVERLAKRMRLA